MAYPAHTAQPAAASRNSNPATPVPVLTSVQQIFLLARPFLAFRGNTSSFVTSSYTLDVSLKAMVGGCWLLVDVVSLKPHFRQVLVCSH